MLLSTDALQVRKVAEENGVDVSESIKELEERAKQVRLEIDTAFKPACQGHCPLDVCLQPKDKLRLVAGLPKCA